MAKSIVTQEFFDKDGNPVDPSSPLVAYGEIHENGDFGERRTYVDYTSLDDGTPAQRWGEADDNEESADDRDWVKSKTWDLRDPQGYDPVETLDQLFRALGVAGAEEAVQFRELCLLIPLPSWEPAPEPLKDEVYQWLKDRRELARR